MIHRFSHLIQSAATTLVVCALFLSLTAPASAMGWRQQSVDLSDKTILVAGASGRAGRYVIRHLKDQGLTIKSLTRSEERAIERWGEDYRDMNWVEGDVRDADRMMEVMDGVDMVISVVGSRDREGPNGPEFVDYGGVVNLVDAAVANDVEHFVLLTALGASDPKHPLNKVLGDALTWRFKGEEHLRASGLAYTIIRPTGLVDTPTGEKGVSIVQGDKWKDIFRGTISRDDLALVFIETLRNPNAHNTTFEIVNRDDLEPGTWKDQINQLMNDDDLAKQLAEESAQP